MVKMNHLFGNQQVTNALSKQVGTSEAIRPLTSSASSDLQATHWDEWLAGLIDGDGCLLVSPAGYTSCEITMGLRDEYALQQVKKQLGGSVKLRSGCRAIRYRLHHKKGIEELVSRINGKIRNSIRKKQLQSICDILGIPLILPTKRLSKENGWFAGFFDADGSITLSMQYEIPQVTIAVSNKHAYDLIDFQYVFGGNIYFEKSSITHKWFIQRKSDILFFLEYIKDFPSRSSKKTRIHLLSRVFEYKQNKFYKAPKDSLQWKAWNKLMEKWTSCEYDEEVNDMVHF